MALKILVVDDSRLMQRIITDYLKKYNITNIDYASNGLEAVEKYKKNLYDFVTLDVVMEGMNGVDTLKEIKKIDNDAKVVMVSSMGQKCFLEEANEAGALDFVVKPFNKDDVDDIMRRLQERFSCKL